MRRNLIFFLWIFLLAFVLVSFYLSLNAYLKERDRRITTNITAFFLGMKGRMVNLPFQESAMLVYSKGSGEKFMSSNVLSNPWQEYDLIQVRVGNDELIAYVKKVSIVDYVSFLLQNYLYAGLMLASLLLYLSVFYFTIKELELSGGGGITEELVNKLKALRLTLATFKIIPEESVEEMRRLVDSILKHNKR